MGELRVPTPIERADVRALAAAIVESVRNDEAMPLPAKLRPQRGPIDQEDVEEFTFDLALEIVALQEDEHERIHRVGEVLVAQSGRVTVEADELRRIYLLGEEHGRTGVVPVDPQTGALVSRSSEHRGPIAFLEPVQLDADEAKALRAIRVALAGGGLDVRRLAMILGLVKVITDHWHTQEGVNGELLDRLTSMMRGGQ